MNNLPPIFVELVAGPPGSAKTTYCEAKRQLLVATAPEQDVARYADRHLVHVNLDPANDGIFPYPCTIDICDLVEVSAVQQESGLGPNGSYLFCIEVIGDNTDWLIQKMVEEATKCVRNDRANAASLKAAGRGGGGGRNIVRPVWFLLDCPGQVEFYVHSFGLAKLVKDLRKKLRAQVSLTHLCDSVVATRDVTSYVATALLCLTSMTDIELPQINVLTKWDLAVAQAKDTISLAKAARRRTLEKNKSEGISLNKNDIEKNKNDAQEEHETEMHFWVVGANGKAQHHAQTEAP